MGPGAESVPHTLRARAERLVGAASATSRTAFSRNNGT